MVVPALGATQLSPVIAVADSLAMQVVVALSAGVVVDAASSADAASAAAVQVHLQGAGPATGPPSVVLCTGITSPQIVLAGIVWRAIASAGIAFAIDASETSGFVIVLASTAAGGRGGTLATMIPG